MEGRNRRGGSVFAQKLIGGKVYQSKLYLESVDLMAWTLTVIIISIILEAVISHSLKRIVKRFTVTDVGGDEK